MRLPLAPTFHEEAERYALRFCCEDCAHFDPDENACAHEWPDDEHRTAFYADPACDRLVFCKEFELR
ncbi:MAG: hypothetical protein IT371_20285 [Deltaproteobacteria bacterium]|nr:hypothetical protein [Deltaproteobacteria bacterium]